MLNDVPSSCAAAYIAREFCGNADAVAALGRMAESRRMPHAFIIEGADGLGKSTFARLIARAAMCTCEEPMAGACSHCRKIRENIHPDLLFVTGSGKINAISIDAVRDMRKEAMIAPNEADKRVFVLEDCDNMLLAAQNAFLKIFEEAPPHAVFVMTCRSAMNLLTTIRSRGRIVTLHPVEPDEGVRFLTGRVKGLDQQRAREVCVSSGGNLGEALRILAGDGGEMRGRADALTRGILAAMCEDSALKLAAECAAIGKDRALGGAVCRMLSQQLRSALMVAVGAQETLDAPSQEVLRLGATVSPDDLIGCMDQINQLSDMLKINISMPLFNTRLAIILQRRQYG